MSVEEIRQAFQRQLQAFGSVKTRGLGGGETRGLKLITVDDIKTDPTGAQIVVTETAPAETTTAATETTTQPASEGTVTAAAGTKSETTTSDSIHSQTASTTKATPSAATENTGATVTATIPGTTTGSSTATVIPASSSDSAIGKPLVYGVFNPDLQVNLNIEFAFDSAALDKSQKPKLEKMCIVLQTTPIDKIRIVGHTDASGTAEYNERLSILRAREVARHLVEECGIEAGRLETIGLGERFPLNAESPKADENRRVEFQALS